MKHIRIYIALLCAIVCWQSAMATDEVINGLKYSLDESTGTATVIANEEKGKSGSIYSGDIVIPSSVRSSPGRFYKVTSIGNKAFYNSSITSITIPGSVTSLEFECFSGCSSLTSITIPESVTSLDIGCFRGCSSLTSITIPESVTSLEENCFYGCSGLTSITIPESVTSLGRECFYDCSSLTSITIPESVNSLGDGCFLGCSSLASITIPKNLGSLGGDCFSGCSSLTSIQVAKGNPVYDSRGNCNAIIKTGTNTMVFGCGSTIIPGSVTSIGNHAFYNSSITSITIPESVTSLGGGCFEGCSSLTSITIPESVTSLGQYCFCGCTGLTSITIPESVTSLGQYCFCGCTGLTSVTIKSVASLGRYCFEGCDNLTVMRFCAQTPPSMSFSSFPENCKKVYVPGAAYEQYKISLHSYGTSGNYIQCTTYPFIERIELSPDFAITCGTEKKMDYKLLPEGADDDAVDWSSSDPSTASVSANGIIKAFQLGNVSICATATDGDNAAVTNSATVVVLRDSVLATSITLSASRMSVERKKFDEIGFTVHPGGNNSPIELDYDSSIIKVESWDKTHVRFQGIAAGETTLTVRTTDGTNVSASCIITVVNFGGDEWTEVTNSNIGSLTGGSVVKICPYGYAGYENAALSSSTGDATYSAYVLTATEYAGQEGGNKWTLIGAGDGTFYLRNGVGLYWAFQQSDAENYFMGTVSDQSEAVKVSFVWNDTYSGVAFKNAYDGTYLCNLGGYNFAYNWYNGDQPLTADTNYTYNVYVSSNKESGIDGVSVDGETDVVYYQLNGIKLAGKPQQDGIYIRVKDGKSQKIVVRKK